MIQVYVLWFQPTPAGVSTSAIQLISAGSQSATQSCSSVGCPAESLNPSPSQLHLDFRWFLWPFGTYGGCPLRGGSVMISVYVLWFPVLF